MPVTGLNPPSSASSPRSTIPSVSAVSWSLAFNFFGPRNFKFFFNLGPQFCYMLSSAIDSNFDYANPTSVEGFPTDNRMTEQMTMKIKNKFDYGICASFGLEPIIGRRNSFTLEARYYFGLGNIYGAAKKDTFSSSRGMAITVTLGYLFRLK